MSFKPMLAAEAVVESLTFPIYASPKLDGVRAIVRNGVVLSRSLKPIPNRHVQALFSGFEGFDGELIVGDPTAQTVYRDTTSGVMSRDGEPDVTFYAFDRLADPSVGYDQRLNCLRRGERVEVLRQMLILNTRDLFAYEESVIAQGYEGLILRRPEAPYKFGRSTVAEGALLKLKRFSDAEFEVVGFEERMHNGNEATTDELGRTKRSSHKENKTGRGDLGALVVKMDSGTTFNVGTGFTDEDRAAIWQERDSFLGRIAKVKFFAGGVKDAPRFPVFLGWRDAIDR